MEYPPTLFLYCAIVVLRFLQNKTGTVMAHYNLIFQGKIIDGASLDEVQSNFARLFKTDAAKTAALFSGKTIVIKKNLDTESTKKYLAILQKAGALIKAVKIEETSDNSPEPLVNNNLKPLSSNTSTSLSSNNNPSNNDTPLQTAADGLSAGLASLVGYNKPKEPLPEDDSSNNEDLQLAPEGSDILDHSQSQYTEKAEIPDTSHLTMSEADTGSLAEFTQKIAAVELPDIDNLTMSEANTGTMEEFSIKAEPVELPDISDLNMAEQDSTPLSAGTPQAVPINIPDTSELSMSEPQEGTLEGIEIKAKPVDIPDISHMKIEQAKEKKDIGGKASFQID